MDTHAVVSALRESHDDLTTRWLGDRAGDTSVNPELLDAVVESLEGDSDGVEGPAAALGVLHAQQGRASSGLVEQIVGLRPVIWGALASLSEVAGDLGTLLLLQEDVTEAVDQALRRATAAYVEESTRVLAHRATRDPLTGLLNRAAFEEALRTAMKAGARSQPPALLLLDLDRFKQVNDTLGHLTGDDVLIRVGETIASAVRGGDVASRLGGDEFAVLLTETSERQATRIARRIVKQVTRDRQLRDLSVTVGISAGVGRLTGGGTPEQLIGVADDALYRAKDAGGNAVEVFTPATKTGEPA